MRKLLLPLSSLYGVGVALRNLFFDIGLLQSSKLSVPVVSIGNLLAGGVGKTPLVEFIVNNLQLRGFKVAVVSRGYGRKTNGTLTVSNGKDILATASEAGDEPLQMAEKLSDVIVIVDEQRVRGANVAIDQYGANVIVLDDGFQHRYICRNLDIVILTASELEQHEPLLPAGNRRDTWSSLNRASLIAVNRFRDLDHFNQLKERLLQKVQKPIIGIETRIVAVHRASTGFSINVQNLKTKKGFLLSGIGAPQSFEQTIRAMGVEIKHHEAFSDHHPYTDSDLARVTALAATTASDYIFTTEKDLMRIRALGEIGKNFLASQPVFWVEIALAVVSGEDLLDRSLPQVVKKDL
ncbi:MAG: tetraacyldisaccharide 4'-kinase [bacterium]